MSKSPLILSSRPERLATRVVISGLRRFGSNVATAMARPTTTTISRIPTASTTLRSTRVLPADDLRQAQFGRETRYRAADFVPAEWREVRATVVADAERLT